MSKASYLTVGIRFQCGERATLRLEVRPAIITAGDRQFPGVQYAGGGPAWPAGEEPGPDPGEVVAYGICEGPSLHDRSRHPENPGNAFEWAVAGSLDEIERLLPHLADSRDALEDADGRRHAFLRSLGILAPQVEQPSQETRTKRPPKKVLEGAFHRFPGKKLSLGRGEFYLDPDDVRPVDPDVDDLADRIWREVLAGAERGPAMLRDASSGFGLLQAIRRLAAASVRAVEMNSAQFARGAAGSLSREVEAEAKSALDWSLNADVSSETLAQRAAAGEGPDDDPAPAGGPRP
jgi:hypothetical protein